MKKFDKKFRGGWWVKGKIQQKYFNDKYPHTIQVLEAEKLGVA
jgi:hypothetical protein